MKSFIKTIVVTLAGNYQKLPVKPFRNILLGWYLKYFQPKLLENKFVIAEKRGIKYRVNLNHFIGVETYYGGGYEPPVSRIIDKYVKPGMTVFDVGANIGIHTCRMAKMAGRNGKVVAFDPDAGILEELKYNLQLNDLKNVVVENTALTDINSLNKYATDKIDFIKIDTDGYECKIIRGGRETIRKFKPVMVIEFCKFTLEEHGDRMEDLIDLLDSLGYSLFSARSLKEYPGKKSLLDIFASLPRTTMNVLCLPKKYANTKH